VYLEKLLDRYFEGWYITGQEEINTYAPMFYGRKMFPDIVMRHKYSKDVIVLDAKFKTMLLRKKDLDYSDFYQIHSYIQYYQPHVLFGGLIYPLGKNINTAEAHSNNLFGQSQHNNGFVVDGISVDPSMSMHEIMESENAFLDRVDNLISKKRKQHTIE